MTEQKFCCPDCGHIDFNWTVTVTEHGYVTSDEHGVITPTPHRKSRRDETAGEFGVECSYCGHTHEIRDLVPQEANDATHV